MDEGRHQRLMQLPDPPELHGKANESEDHQLGMKQSKRELYVLTNPALPGLIKVGLTTQGAESRARTLTASAAVPENFEVAGAYEFPNEIETRELHQLEREAHKRLTAFRYPGSREFFKTTPEQAGRVLQQLQKEAKENIARGLNPAGRPRQPVLLEISPQPSDKRASRPPVHWHVWEERDQLGKRVTNLELLPKTYWTKSGANGRVKKVKADGRHGVCILCQDTECPDFGQTKAQKDHPRTHRIEQPAL